MYGKWCPGAAVLQRPLGVGCRLLAQVCGAIFAGQLLLVSGCARQPQLQHIQTFQRAQQVFEQAKDEADYRQAAELYQQILDAGVVSGELLYDQGNAYFRADDMGRAIAAYRRAHRYRPADRRLASNLQAAMSKSSVVGDYQPYKSPVMYILFWQDWCSYRAKFLWCVVSIVCLLIIGVLRAGWTRFTWLRSWHWLAGLLVVLSAVSAGYDWYRFDYQRHGVIVEASVIARKGDAPSYAAAFTEPLAEGTEFQLLGQRNNWLRIRVADQEAWIEGQQAVTY